MQSQRGLPGASRQISVVGGRRLVTGLHDFLVETLESMQTSMLSRLMTTKGDEGYKAISDRVFYSGNRGWRSRQEWLQLALVPGKSLADSGLGFRQRAYIGDIRIGRRPAAPKKEALPVHNGSGQRWPEPGNSY